MTTGVIQRFKVGDHAWAARTGKQKVLVTCPDCKGTGRLTCILGDGTQVGFDCSCCDKDYFQPTGKVTTYQFEAIAEQIPITGLEMSETSIRYHSGSENCYRVYEDSDLFMAKEDALIRSRVLQSEEEKGEQERFKKNKDQARKSWAQNVTYHRDCIRSYEKDLEYHKGKLAIAQSKIK